jgi:Cd(II)/Pb(II)-responsive transcriptional regulator
MRIGEIARLTGCNVQTLRYYEKEGLLPAPDRTSSGYRKYSHIHAERLNFIRHCRSLDMSLTEIKQLLIFCSVTMTPCADVNHLVDQHIGQVEQKINDFQHLKQQLIVLRRTCDSNIDDNKCGILQTLAAAAAADGKHCPCHNFAKTASGSDNHEPDTVAAVADR